LLFFALLVAGGVVLAIVLVSRGHQHTSLAASMAGHVVQQSEAVRILDERFARGEADDDEYQRRKRLLSTGPSPSG
jgi:uncharacterized membrane protein